MLVTASNTCLKCGKFGVPHLPKRAQRWCLPKALSTFSPSLIYLAECTRYRTSIIRGLRYTMSSTQVMEKTWKNVDIEECLPELPVPSPYEKAMEALSSLITGQKRGDRSSVGGKYGKLERMSMYLKILGLEEKINGLKIIHVAGTKGKGSTCTFCEAILRECGFQTGLFTSPHLIDVRERIRINGLDISEDKFLLHFWECWDRLKENLTDGLPMPPLFQFLTVLAFKVFISEQIDVAIIEVGLGGARDSTNVIKEPVVCGIASLGMDHTESLGNTIGQIASHKAGIFKPEVPAFTVPQLSEAMDIIQQRAHELMVPLDIAAPLDQKILEGKKLGLSGDHQFINAGLAVSLCKCWLHRTRNWEKIRQNNNWENNLPEPFLRGLSTAHISGRAQVVHDIVLEPFISLGMAVKSSGNLTFYLDGAHSPESMVACAQWFSAAIKENRNSSPSQSSAFCKDEKGMEYVMTNGYALQRKQLTRESDKIPKQVLLFNCMDVRDPQILLPQLVNTCSSSGTHFSKALFVPAMSMYSKVTSGTIIPSDIYSRDLIWQFRLQRLWEKIIHGADIALDNQTNQIDSVEILPPHNFLYWDISSCNPADKLFTCSAVIPSLPLAIKWLRDYARENPSLQLQVLVTGSLHLVGDVLKLLKR